MNNDQIVKSKKTLHPNPTPEEYGIVLSNPVTSKEFLGLDFASTPKDIGKQRPSGKDIQLNLLGKDKSGKNIEKKIAQKDINRIATNYESWSKVIASVNDGTYAEKYSVGAMMPLDLCDEGVVTMVLVAMEADELADGSGKAHMTWVSKTALKTKHRMNPGYAGAEGTGSAGGWEQCEMRSWLQDTILPKMPLEVRKAVKEVKKTSAEYSEEGYRTVVTRDALWIPSRREIFGGSAMRTESQGPEYKDIFSTKTNRKIIDFKVTGASWWWLRSASVSSSFNYVFDGNYNDACADIKGGVVVGFCL